MNWAWYYQNEVKDWIQFNCIDCIEIEIPSEKQLHKKTAKKGQAHKLQQPYHNNRQSHHIDGTDSKTMNLKEKDGTKGRYEMVVCEDMYDDTHTHKIKMRQEVPRST